MSYTSPARIQEEATASWRQSDFVTAHSGKGWTACTTLHRSTCRILSVEKRSQSSQWSVSTVRPTTQEEWTGTVGKSGRVSVLRVCKVCCTDLRVENGGPLADSSAANDADAKKARNNHRITNPAAIAAIEEAIAALTVAADALGDNVMATQVRSRRGDLAYYLSSRG